MKNTFLSFILCLSLVPGCKSAEMAMSGEKKLLGLTMSYNTVNYQGKINNDAQTVTVDLPWNTYLANLKCEAEVSPKATFTLSDSVDFTLPQILTVMAEDKTKAEYKINVTNAQALNLNDEKIEVLGCSHVTRDSKKIVMLRFNQLNLDEPRINYMLNGQTQSGVILRFTTNSRFVRLKFAETKGARWGTDYGVWADGVWHNQYINHNFTLQKPAGKDFVSWEISPSLMNAVDLVGIDIENGTEITQNTLPKQAQYFAIGNSITQGVGQGNAGYKSYPFLFGKKMGYETFNLGVGGSKVSWKVATELENKQVDMISVLWGYNDWYFVGETAASYRNMMQALLLKIREYQPNTPLVCISLIGTENPTPFTGVNIYEYRSVLAQLVAERIAAGDKNIYLLDGSTVNVELMDKVHPSVKGAADLAIILEDFVKKTILTP